MPESYILVVDDETAFLEAMTMRLENAGYHVTTASDAWQTVIQARGIKLWLVIMDIRMPGVGTGVDAYKRLREASKTLPVIFVTNLRLKNAAEMIPSDPQMRLLSKPVNFDELRRAIKSLTGVDRKI